MTDRVQIPEWAVVWHVELPPHVADRLRRQLGSDRRAAADEVDHGAYGAPPENARAFRVDADEPIVTFVEHTWPRWNIRGVHNRMIRYLRTIEPVELRDDPERDLRAEPLTLGEFVWYMRDLGLDLADLEISKDGQS